MNDVPRWCLSAPGSAELRERVEALVEDFGIEEVLYHLTYLCRDRCDATQGLERTVYRRAHTAIRQAAETVWSTVCNAKESGLRRGISVDAVGSLSDDVQRRIDEWDDKHNSIQFLAEHDDQVKALIERKRAPERVTESKAKAG